MGNLIHLVITIMLAITVGIALHDTLSSSGIVWKHKAYPNERKASPGEKFTIFFFFLVLVGSATSSIFMVLGMLHIAL